jgi:hypothetical protein
MQNQAHRVSEIPKPGSNPASRAPPQVSLHGHPQSAVHTAGGRAGNLAEIPLSHRTAAREREDEEENPHQNANEKASPRLEKPDRVRPAARCPGPHQSRGRHSLSSPLLGSSPPLPLLRSPRRGAEEKAKGDGRGRKRLRDFCGTPTPPPPPHHHHRAPL